MFSNERKYQGEYGEIKHSYAYEKFHFKGKTKGLALKYVKEGCETYLINGQVIDVKQGQFILVREGQVFEAKAKLKAKNIHGLCIDLNPEALDIDLEKIYHNPILFNLPFDCCFSSPLGHKLNNLRSTTFSRSESDDQILMALKKQVHVFSDEINKLHLRLSSQTRKTNTQRAILGKLLSANNFIHKYFSRKIKLDDLAKYAGISKFHFIRLFKLCFQQSPLELQDSLRMKKAIELIDEKNLNMSRVAFDLGFLDLASFSNKFSKHYGLSPSHYRKMMN